MTRMDDAVPKLRQAVELRRELAEAATEAPWQARPLNHSGGNIWLVDVEPTTRAGFVAAEMTQHDAEHIAANDPESVIEMCDGIERIMKMYERMCDAGDEKLLGVGMCIDILAAALGAL